MSGIFYTADGRRMNMEGFADAAQPASSLEDSLRLKGNLSLDGTIRAGKFLMADGSEMKTVIQEQKVAAIPESVSFDAQGNMAVGSKTNGNKLLFSTKWTGFPDDKPNGAEISNDTDDFKQLMIVGNKSAGGVRTVGVWDKLNVNGQLCVGSKCVDENSFGPSAGGAAGGAITGKKGSGWGSAVNVDAPQEAESLYSLHFGDGKNVHDRQAGMGYIKGQPDASKLFGNTRGTLGMHIHQDDDYQIYSSGWKPLFGVKGGTGEVKVRGPMTVNKMTFLKQDNSPDNDPYTLEKLGSGDDHHLRLTINDNDNESFQIWGNSCGAGNCGGEGKMAQKFQSNGNAEITGLLKTSVLQLGDKFRFSGIGDGHGNDTWLRMFNKENNAYYGGIAMKNLWVEDGVLQKSDRRAKEDIKEVNSKEILEKINRLKVYTYKLKECKKDIRKYGFIAQELQKEFPEMVEEGPNGMLAVDYNQMTAILLDAVNFLAKSQK